jgi:hypothetical protein
MDSCMLGVVLDPVRNTENTFTYLNLPNLPTIFLRLFRYLPVNAGPLLRGARSGEEH